MAHHASRCIAPLLTPYGPPRPFPPSLANIVSVIDSLSPPPCEQIVEVIDPFARNDRLLQLLQKHHSSRTNRIIIFVLYKKEAPQVWGSFSFCWPDLQLLCVSALLFLPATRLCVTSLPASQVEQLLCAGAHTSSPPHHRWSSCCSTEAHTSSPPPLTGGAAVAAPGVDLWLCARRHQPASAHGGGWGLQGRLHPDPHRDGCCSPWVGYP